MYSSNIANDCIDRNFAMMKNALKSPIEKLRHNILKAFVANEKSSISLGCGGYEPVIIGTQHASDVQARAEKYLRSVGFAGSFTHADIRALPFHNREFKVAVCSEVLEHLDCLNDVVSAVFEIARVADTWIISTPHHACDDPDHKFHFTQEQLKDIFANINHKIFIKDYFFYITNDDKKLNRILAEL